MSTRKRISGDYVIQTLNGGDSITLITNETVIQGNLTVTGNAVLVGNINADRIFNGTSNVEIATPGGNVTVGVGGVNNILDLGTTGATISGLASVTGNITSANVNTVGLVTATGNVTGGNVNSLGNVFVTRTSAGTANATIRFVDTDDTVIVGQVGGIIEWFTSDATPGARVTSAIRSIYTGVTGTARVDVLTSTGGAANVRLSVLDTGNVGVGNTAPVHLLSINGNVYIDTTITAVGNVTGGNLLTAGSATATGNIQAGNVNTAGVITATGNITANNIGALGQITAGAAGISTTGNVTGGNLLVNGIISASGNLTTTDIFATTLSLTGNIIGNVSTALNVFAGASVDTPLVVTNIITSDDSSAVKFNDGIIVDSDIDTNASVNALGNVTGNNITGVTSVTVPAYADDAARNTAIATPVTGMLIYNIANVKFQGFTGANWVDLN